MLHRERDRILVLLKSLRRSPKSPSVGKVFNWAIARSSNSVIVTTTYRKLHPIYYDFLLAAPDQEIFERKWGSR